MTAAVRVMEGPAYPGAVIPPELRARLDAGERPLLRWHLDLLTYRVTAWDPATSALVMERVPDWPAYNGGSVTTTWRSAGTTTHPITP